MNEQSQRQHAWLQRLIGEWAYEAQCVMGPDQPPTKTKGVEAVRTLGGLWVLCEGRGEMPGGGEATTLMTLGFDPRRGRFVGTFVASMMTHLWVYDGALDTAERVLTLNTEGPSFADPASMMKYRDVIEIEGNDRRTLASSMLADDGQWREFMRARYLKKG